MKEAKKKELVTILESLLQACAIHDGIDPSDEDAEDDEIFKANQEATSAYARIEKILRARNALPEWAASAPATVDYPI